MRLRFRPPPEAETLGKLQVDEMVRDYPELLPFLEGKGVSVREEGGRPLSAESLEAWGDGLLASTAWRRWTPS